MRALLQNANVMERPSFSANPTITQSRRMNWARSSGRRRFFRNTTSLCAALLVACSPEQKPAAADDRSGFATQYADAWSSNDPVRFGQMYEKNGSLIVNGSASTGRAAIVETARLYMAAFPDMVVRLDSLREEPDVTVFHWTWTGTNTGPGGTGKAVNLQGYERWTFGPNGLLLTSDGRILSECLQ